MQHKPRAWQSARIASIRDVGGTMPRVKIALLSATFPPYRGGAGTVAFNHARELADRGHHVEVLTALSPGEVHDPNGAVVRRERPVFQIGNAPLIPRIAGLRGFDVIHFHHPFIFGTELALFARRRSPRTALVVAYHNRLIGERGRRPLFWLYEETSGRALLRSADRVCPLSENHAAGLPTVAALRRRAPRRVSILPNGVDTDAFAPGPDEARIRAANGIAPDAVVALVVATLDRAHYLKRVDVAIDALARAGHPRLHMLVAGGGEWLDRYSRQAESAGVAERTTFLGPLDHARLPDAMRASDLLVVSSDREAFPLVLLEAMSSGLPTIASDLPGTRAVVRDGETGLLVPPGNPAAAATAMERLAEAGAERRRAMGLRGRADCEARYAWPLVIDRLEAIYRDAMEERRSR
jgi:glycosyltransferase involved in cell wall biosynthesis